MMRNDVATVADDARFSVATFLGGISAFVFNRVFFGERQRDLLLLFVSYFPF